MESLQNGLSNEQPRRTVILPSGKVAAIRAGTGRDVLEALRAVGTNYEEMTFALIARKCLIDGRGIVKEDVLDLLDDADVLMLMGEISGRNVVPLQAVSPDLSTSDSQPPN